MTVSPFRNALLKHLEKFCRDIVLDNGDWVVKGFIDIYKNIYPISSDTKVISKIVELMLLPSLFDFADRHKLKVELGKHQNHYPDVSFVARNGAKIALDVKSTYRTTRGRVNGFTLGAFTGYFRLRNSTKNVTFPYSSYKAHLVLGIIYSRSKAVRGIERRKFSLKDLRNILSVAKSFEFLLQEKWRIASTRPGSGNTKNIGSETDIKALFAGKGPFSKYGEAVFDDYWMNYLTKGMARDIDSKVPYQNLEEYFVWRGRDQKKIKHITARH